VDTTVGDFSATRSGDTLVLAYNETERSTVGGQTFQVRLARLDVYVRRNGRWLLQTTRQGCPMRHPGFTCLRNGWPSTGIYDYGFERDAAGRITTQVYRSGTQVLRARRRE
jgi:hypothetical protein